MQKSNWKKCKLINETISIGDGIHGTPTYDANSDVFFINGNNLLKGHICLKKDTKRVSSAQATIHQDILGEQTILISINGTLGNVAYYCNEPVVLGKSACYVNINSQNDKRFFYYLFSSPMFQQYLHYEATGTTIKNVSLRSIRNFEFLLPALEEQKQIAEILGSLDDKIELLQKQNKTLEDMAKALFKSWFVDFDVVRAKQKGLPKADIMREYHLTEELYDLFPSSFADSPLGPIPSGWEVKPLGAICQLALGGTPSRTNLKYWEKGSIPWINSGKVNDFRIITPSEYITEAGYNSSATKLLPIHTTVVAITGATLGQVSFTEIECCANQSVVGVLENEKLASEYIYLFILFNLDKLLAKQTGGAQQHINKNDIASLICLVPSEKILEQYQQQQKPLFDKIHNNMVQIQTLTELRDTLLPRLISGKIEV